MRRVLVIAAALLSPIPAHSTGASAAPTFNVATVSPCSDASQVAATLMAKVQGAEAARGFLNWDAARIVAQSVTQVSGPCVAEIDAFVISRLYFRSGAQLDFRYEDGHFSAATRAGNYYSYTGALTPASPHPQTPFQFLMASNLAVQVNNGAERRYYVGVWKDGDTYRIGTFASLGDNRFTNPKWVLSSAYPIKSVTYLSNPHGDAGRLSVLVSAASDAKLIALDWYHNNIFFEPIDG